MRSSAHLFVLAIIAAFLYQIFGWKVIFTIAGGVLIDIDHYFWYIYKFRKFNIVDCYKYFLSSTEKDNFKINLGILLIFHTIEFLLIVAILSIYNEIILLFTIGLLSHYLLDLIWLYTVPKQLIANHSLISWIYKNKIQKV